MDLPHRQLTLDFLTKNQQTAQVLTMVHHHLPLRNNGDNGHVGLLRKLPIRMAQFHAG